MTLYGWIFAERPRTRPRPPAVYERPDGTEVGVDAVAESATVSPLYGESLCVGEVGRWLRTDDLGEHRCRMTIGEVDPRSAE